jgi:microcystin-dependent protein
MSYSERDHTDAAARYVDRLAGYDQRLTLLERGHIHHPQTPVGAMVDWPGPAIPDLWEPCDGRSLNATAYPDLFAILGYTWGGAGINFNLPDLRGRSSIGAGQGAGLTNRVLAAAAGTETVALTAAQNGAHIHGFNTTSAFDPGQHYHAALSMTATAGGINHNHGGFTGGQSALHDHNLLADWGFFAAAGGQSISIIVGDRQVGANNQDHNHNIVGDTATHGHNVTGDTSGANAPHAHNVDGTTGDGGSVSAPHPNMTPFAVVNKIIKVLPDQAAAYAALTIIERKYVNE